MNDGEPRVLLSPEQLRSRVRALGRKITKDYSGRSLHVVALSKGALIFNSDLIRAIELPLRYDIVSASSYKGGKSSSGTVSISGDEHLEIAGQHVLLVDEILDSGRTLSAAISSLRKKEPASLKTCVLLDKPSRRVMPICADYVGFEIDDLFVVGYGLDDKEFLRNLPYVGVFDKA